ncbi:MAG: hypothetical protein HY515_02710 [Candidatus Aenigmarchaeota archaeon]|nr:hypothetical protein [Candidatus Aenigmarchaeota archaeon]
MVIAFLLAFASSLLLTGRLSENRLNYERIFYSLVLSFALILSGGVVLNFIRQIGSVQLIVVNLLLLGVLLAKYKKFGLGKLELDLNDYLVMFVFVIAFLVRGLPIISDPMPFGSYDIIQHYAMAIETHERGSVPDNFPKYMNWYGASQDNANGIWLYPPGTAIMMASMKSVFSLPWPQTIHLFAALFDSLSVLIIYMIAGRLLKNKVAGLVGGSLFSISGKNIFSLYFGQVAYELGIMLALFAILIYIIESHSRRHRIILSGLVGGLSFLVSPLAAGYFMFAAFFISLSESCRSKKLSHIKDFAVVVAAVFLVSAFFLPKFAMWFSFFSAKPSGTPDSLSLPDLVWPYKMIAKQPGLPGWYFDPNVTMGTLWLILLVIGLAIMFFTKIEGRKILAPWFIADYILTHSYILWGPLGFGVLYDYAGRWMAQSSVVLALIAGLIATYKISNKDGKILLSRSDGISLGYAAFVLILLVYAPAKLAAASTLYAQPQRMTTSMYSLMGDLRTDTKENSAMLVFSANVQAADERRGLIEALSKTRVYTNPNVNNDILNLTFTHTYTGGFISYQTRYIMFDYGGFARAQQFADYVKYYRNAENALFGNTQPTFYNDEVRVYRLGLG